ncbi:MAG: hypothetical protein IJ328_07535 [Muribaculaceae bacterium]|nr:hypothetical protein [Muribaculaceae bacterium]
MDLDELKNKWKQLDEHVKAQDDKIRELTDQVMAGKAKSPLKRLKRHCLIGAVLVPLMLPYFLWCYEFIGLECSEWMEKTLYVMTWVFIMFTWVREIYLYMDLSRINVSRVTVVEALRGTIRFRKHYHYGVLIDLILGMITIVLMLLCFNKNLMIGGMIGGLIGGAIGFKLFRYYERKIDELESSLKEWNSNE